MATREELQKQLVEGVSKAFDNLIDRIVAPSKDHIDKLVQVIEGLEIQVQGQAWKPDASQIDLQQQLAERQKELDDLRFSLDGLLNERDSVIKEQERQINEVSLLFPVLRERNFNRASLTPADLDRVAEIARTDEIVSENQILNATIKNVHVQLTQRDERIRELEETVRDLRGKGRVSDDEAIVAENADLKASLFASQIRNTELEERWRLQGYKFNIGSDILPPGSDTSMMSLAKKFAELKLKSTVDSQRVDALESQLRALEDSRSLLRSELKRVRDLAEGHECPGHATNVAELEAQLNITQRRSETLHQTIILLRDEAENQPGQTKPSERTQSLLQHVLGIRRDLTKLRFRESLVDQRPQDQEIASKYRGLNRNIQNLVRKYFHEDSIDNPIKLDRVEQRICELMDPDLVGFQFAPGDRQFRIAAGISDILHTQILAGRLFGAEEWTVTDVESANEVEIAPGLRAFEEALLGSEHVRAEDVVMWRNMTIDRINELQWKTNLVSKANVELLKLLEPLLLEMDDDVIAKAAKDFILDLCQKAFDWRLMARKGVGLIECVVPGKRNANYVPISDLHGPGDSAAFEIVRTEGGENAIRSNDIAYTMYGAVLKGLGPNVTVLVPGAIVAEEEEEESIL